MKQWLNTPVTYGDIIRILLCCVFVFVLSLFAFGAAFNIGNFHWSAVSATIFAGSGTIIGLGTWLFPFPTDKPAISREITIDQAFELLTQKEEDYLKTKSHQEIGTLLVSTPYKEKEGANVYLLPRDDFLNCKHSHELLENNGRKRVATVTGARFGPHLLFVARFRDLPKGRYNAWVGWGIDNPTSVPAQIAKGCVSELGLDKLSR
jgi:hypothetical protein